MDNITLPDDLTTTSPGNLWLYDYHADRESSRQQVTLSQNTISFLQEGEKEIINDSTNVAIDDSRFLVMTAGNCLMTEKFSSEKTKYSSLLLFFSNQSLLTFVNKYQVSLPEKSITTSAQAFVYDSFIRTFIQSLRDLMQLNQPVRDKLLAIKFEELMLYLMERDGPQFIRTLMDHVDERAFDFVKVVETNKHHKLTLKQLAFLSNMSVSTFKRAFERHYQESPMKWFQDKRLEYAALLLKNESKRPSDIYLDMGYESLSNFIQAFKHKYGQTPKQYQLMKDAETKTPR